MFVFIFFIQLISLTLKCNAQEYRHKISMVSSYVDPEKPALFLHGESPVWDVKNQELLFVDVHAQSVHRLNYNTGKITEKKIAYGQVNLVSPVAKSDRLLVSVRSALYLLDWETSGESALRLLSTVDHGMPDNVINDGKPDAFGRFWAGTKGPQMMDEVVPDKASFYSFEQEDLGNPKVQIRPVSISNGLVWSINNTVLYYIDSLKQTIDAFDFDLVKGELSRRRQILDLRDFGYYDAIPDGMTIDSNGHLWVAIMFGGAVWHIDPDSKQLIYEYKLPVSRVTSVTWGGPKLDELFVTSARDKFNPSNESLAGAIFTISGTGCAGMPPHLFKFDKADAY